MSGVILLIGKVAEKARTNPKTIRYYEAIGLLPKPQHGENGYRLYSEEVVGVFRFIKKAQGLGFTLSEIKAAICPQIEGAPLEPGPRD